MHTQQPSLNDRLNVVFQEVFDDQNLTVGPATTAADVDGWDSLMHISLIVHVEKAFGVRLNAAQMSQLKTVGELLTILSTQR